MSENEETDLDIAVNYQDCEFDRHKALAELARLRAVDEAWRAVLGMAHHYPGLIKREIQKQITRLDQLKEGKA